ncbi:MAG: hypothetical protein JWO36_5600 [Myxococcales bacterium]|nr:hypothetical protein [Myxococcales bacterium]
MNPATEMQRVIDDFVSRVTDLAKRAALEAIGGAMGMSSSSYKHRPSSGGRAKRGAEQMEAMKAKILRAIKDHPGKRSEELNAALGTTTKELALPLRQLVADKLVTTKGQRRGMTYYAKSSKS